jgi:hypothetical protein
MAQKRFDGQNIDSLLQQVGGVAVAQGVQGDGFSDAGFFDGLRYDPLGAPLGERLTIYTFKQVRTGLFLPEGTFQYLFSA